MHKCILAGLLGISLLVSPAFAQSTVDVAWNVGGLDDGPEAGWCTGPTAIGPAGECHSVICRGDTLFYSLFFERLEAKGNATLKLEVDGQNVLSGLLTTYFNSGTKRGLRINLHKAAVEALKQGNEVVVTRFGQPISNTLKGSGSSIQAVLDHCRPPVDESLRSVELDGLCRPYQGLVNFQGQSVHSIVYADRFFYRNRRGGINSFHNTGRREFRNFRGKLMASVVYSGVDANFGGLGCKFDLSTANPRLTAGQLRSFRQSVS